METRAEAIFAKILEMGNDSILDGVIRGIEENWFQSEIAESSYIYERKVNSGRRQTVSVNSFFEGNEDLQPEILEISNEVEKEQIKRLEKVKTNRSSEDVINSLEELKLDAMNSEINLMQPILKAVRARATVGEIMNSLADVFGRWKEDSVI